MNTKLLATVFLCAVMVSFSNGVKVTVEDFTFSLESVKRLGPILNDMPPLPRMVSKRANFVCSNSNLPEEFVPACNSPKASRIFQVLAPISRTPQACEICANVACSGC